MSGPGLARRFAAPAENPQEARLTAVMTWPVAGPPSRGRARTITDPAAIEAALAELGVRYDRWPVRPEVPRGAPGDAVVDAYRTRVDQLIAAEGFVQVDVAALHPTDDPDFPARAAKARATFLAEHSHADDEVRFFAAGRGVFYLHIPHPTRGDEVHAVLCEAGDLLWVPAGTTHWFDMGTRPSFTAIRFFHDADGWVGAFTGDDIATRFPDFDALTGAVPATATTP